MRLIDYSFASPAENLALDEALLDEAEAGESGEALRFWESPVHFVVLGLSQSLREHVYEDACAADGIPILRRCSAGGCVLQGPGCLNYSLILRTDRPGCGTIRESYRTILESIAVALRAAGAATSPAGISDLAAENLKVSGSAQRRRKSYFLHHGTLLYAFALPLVARYLREPADRPEYRQSRPHSSFVTNLPLPMNACSAAVSKAFHADKAHANAELPLDRVAELVSQKYASRDWTRRK